MARNKIIKHRFVELLEKGLAQTRKKLIAEEKKKNGYLVVSDKDGRVKKIPAKDLK
jgi:hypothetical protein